MHAGGFARVLASQTTGILDSFSYPWPSLIVSCQAAALDDLTLCKHIAFSTCSSGRTWKPEVYTSVNPQGIGSNAITAGVQLIVHQPSEDANWYTQ